MTTYWIARGLAERGHQVHMVTNANEVECAYRLSLGPGDQEWLEPRFASGGSVTVHPSAPVAPGRLSHIPQSNPFVTRLAGIATQVTFEHRCELILAYYYEPYGVAAYLASRFTGRPYVLQHAGSDLDRLMQVPDLAVTYREILKAAHGVLTRPPLVSRFLGMGVPEERIFPDLPFGLPGDLFHPQAPPMNVAQVLKAAGGDVPSGQLPGVDCPTLGIYGKVGVAKGSFDLLAALASLKREGLNFELLAMTQGGQTERFADRVRAYDLSERTFLIPFQPHWRVPGFIRRCTAVCFLERDFPVAIHGPIIPREVLACGTCLVCSQEIAERQRYRDSIRDGENMLVVRDPKNHAELADKLRTVIVNPQCAPVLGAAGRSLTTAIEDYAGFMDGTEAFLRRMLGQPSPTRSYAELAGEEELPGLPTLARVLWKTVPWLCVLLGDELEALAQRFGLKDRPPGENPFAAALRFCDFVLGAQSQGSVAASRYPCFLDVVRYHRSLARASFHDDSDLLPYFSASDDLSERDVTAGAIGQLKLLKGNYVWVQSYAFDVTELFTHDPRQLWAAGAAERDQVLRSLPARPLFLLTIRRPNLDISESRINDSTRRLLELADGSRTSIQILDTLLLPGPPLAEQEVEAHGAKLLSCLSRLYNLGAVVFTKAGRPSLRQACAQAASHSTEGEKND